MHASCLCLYVLWVLLCWLAVVICGAARCAVKLASLTGSFSSYSTSMRCFRCSADEVRGYCCSTCHDCQQHCLENQIDTTTTTVTIDPALCGDFPPTGSNQSCEYYLVNDMYVRRGCCRPPDTAVVTFCDSFVCIVVTQVRERQSPRPLLHHLPWLPATLPRCSGRSNKHHCRNSG